MDHLARTRPPSALRSRCSLPGLLAAQPRPPRFPPLVRESRQDVGRDARQGAEERRARAPDGAASGRVRPRYGVLAHAKGGTACAGRSTSVSSGSASGARPSLRPSGSRRVRKLGRGGFAGESTRSLGGRLTDRVAIVHARCRCQRFTRELTTEFLGPTGFENDPETGFSSSLEQTTKSLRRGSGCSDCSAVCLSGGRGRRVARPGGDGRPA